MATATARRRIVVRGKLTMFLCMHKITQFAFIVLIISRWEVLQVIKITRSLMEKILLCILLAAELFLREQRATRKGECQTVEQFMKLKFRSMVHYSWRWWSGGEKFLITPPFMLLKTLQLPGHHEQNNSFSHRNGNCLQLVQATMKEFLFTRKLANDFLCKLVERIELGNCAMALCSDNELTD